MILLKCLLNNFLKNNNFKIMTTIIKSGIKQIELEQILNKTNSVKKFNAKKFSGIIKLKEAPLDIQSRMRDEWK